MAIQVFEYYHPEVAFRNSIRLVKKKKLNSSLILVAKFQVSPYTFLSSEIALVQSSSAWWKLQVKSLSKRRIQTKNIEEVALVS